MSKEIIIQKIYEIIVNILKSKVVLVFLGFLCFVLITSAIGNTGREATIQKQIQKDTKKAEATFESKVGVSVEEWNFVEMLIQKKIYDVVNKTDARTDIENNIYGMMPVDKDYEIGIDEINKVNQGIYRADVNISYWSDLNLGDDNECCDSALSRYSEFSIVIEKVDDEFDVTRILDKTLK